VIKSVNDTNVWVAGINWETGTGYQIRLHWEARRFQHFISAEILYEIIRVLREVCEYPDEKLYDWYWLLLTGSVFVVPRVTINVIQEDPDDDKFIACAIEGGVDYIVSEDKDLQRLNVYDSIEVPGKHEFLEVLEAQES
jgi:putative PIN family toxin of toxin-antitoxin system